jgi:hypothetical protein
MGIEGDFGAKNHEFQRPVLSSVAIDASLDIIRSQSCFQRGHVERVVYFLDQKVRVSKSQSDFELQIISNYKEKICLDQITWHFTNQIHRNWNPRYQRIQPIFYQVHPPL